MQQRIHSARILGALVASVLIAGCTGAAGATQSPAASALGGTKTFTIAGVGTPGVSTVALMAAIDDLKAQGYTIDYPEIDNQSQITQGLASGQFQLSSGATNTVLIAAQKGAPLKIIGDRAANEWSEVSVNAIAQCSDLQGKRWSHASQTGVSQAMGRTWLKQTCPGTTTQESIIPDSPKRANALLAGQIDATELELGDATRLTTANSDKFHILANFGKTLPDLKPTTIYGNADWIAKNPGSVVDFLKAILTEDRKIAADATGGYLKSLIAKYAPGVDKATLDVVVKAYLDGGIFEGNGGLTQANLTYTLKFFTDAGIVPAGVTVDQVADLTYLNTALQQLGG